MKRPPETFDARVIAATLFLVGVVALVLFVQGYVAMTAQERAACELRLSSQTCNHMLGR